MNKNKKFFQSGAGSNIGSFSNFYKKSKKTNTNTEGQISDEILDDLESKIDSNTRKLNTKVNREEGKTLSDENFKHSEKKKLDGIESGANNYIHPDKHSISEILELQSKLDEKVQKDGVKGLSEEDFTSVLKNKLNDIDLNRIVSGSQDTGITIVSEDIFEIEKSGFYYASAAAKNTPERMVGFFILEVLSKRDKRITFSGPEQNVIYTIQKQDGKWLEWQSFSQIPPELKTKLSDLPDSKALESLFGGKIDQHPTKDLSTNDYSNTEKSKLSGIATGANKYVHPSTHSMSEVSGLSSKLDTKVDKEQNKGLSTNDFTNTEKSKLSGIETGANKYVHPASHSMSEISGLSSELDTKVDKEPNKGLSTNDFTSLEKTKLSKAWTSSNDGSGSGLDADKLDGLEAAQFGVKSSSQTWTKKNVFSDDVTFGMGSDLNNYHIQKIHQDSAASYNERVVLLIPKSITNQAQVNKCVGTIVLSKLGGNVWDVVNVSIQSVWNTVKGSMISEGMNSSKNRLVYCNYKGTKWVALKIGYTANPHNNMFFNGHSIVFTDDVNRLKCIAYKNNKTGAVLNKEIFDSIEEVKGLNDDIYVNNGIKLVNHHEILSINDLNTKFNSKIDKHPSKDLSTNDYSNAEKSKLAGIATGAERNVNPDWNATSGDAFIKNKPVIPNPVKLENELNASSESGLTNQAITKALDDKEDRFGKRTGFNKNFGTSSGTVAQGNDSRINNGQTAYTWGNHANANYIKSNSSGNVGIGASTPATKLHVNGGHLRVQSAYGYADFGSLNSSFFHFNTNRPKYYFNRKTEIDGDVKIYGKNTYLRKSDGAVIENGSRLAKHSTVDQLNKRIDELQKHIEAQTISKLEVDRESFKILSRAGKSLAEIPLEVLKEAILG